MSAQLGPHNIIVADPPGIKIHVEAEDESHCDIGEEWYAEHIDDFLLLVGVFSEQGRRMLGEMMCAVVLPETVVVVHEAVIPVEPKIEDYAVCTDEYWQHEPFHVDGRCGLVICEPSRHCHSKSDSGE